MTTAKDLPLDLTHAKDVQIIPGHSLHAKLAEVMAEAENIPKNGTYTGQGSFKYVLVGDAAKVIRTALGVRHVSMLPAQVEVISEAEHATRSGGTMTTLTLRTTWILTDGETGETATIQSIGTGADSGDKASPKAQTNAMKYALLMGFLLSTGDDPEQSDSSDRRPKQRGSGMVSDTPYADAPPLHDEPIEHNGIGGLVGTVEKGKPPVDMETRITANEGAVWGFALVDGRTKFQVVAKGELAEKLANQEIPVGTRVTVWGPIEAIPWDKKMTDGTVKVLHFNRIALERVKGPNFDLSAPVEAPSLPLFDPAESARLDAEEAAASA
jgi:hypothetical protein